MAHPDLAPLYGAITELTNQVRNMQATSEQKFDQLNRAITQVEGKVGALDGKLEALDGKLEALDGKLEALDGKVEDIGRKVDVNTEGLLKVRIMVSQVSCILICLQLVLIVCLAMQLVSGCQYR